MSRSAPASSRNPIIEALTPTMAQTVGRQRSRPLPCDITVRVLSAAFGSLLWQRGPNRADSRDRLAPSPVPLGGRDATHPAEVSTRFVVAPSVQDRAQAWR